MQNKVSLNQFDSSDHSMSNYSMLSAFLAFLFRHNKLDYKCYDCVNDQDSETLKQHDIVPLIQSNKLRSNQLSYYVMNTTRGLFAALIHSIVKETGFSAAKKLILFSSCCNSFMLSENSLSRLLTRFRQFAKGINDSS